MADAHAHLGPDLQHFPPLRSCFGGSEDDAVRRLSTQQAPLVPGVGWARDVKPRVVEPATAPLQPASGHTSAARQQVLGGVQAHEQDEAHEQGRQQPLQPNELNQLRLLHAQQRQSSACRAAWHTLPAGQSRE